LSPEFESEYLAKPKPNLWKLIKLFIGSTPGDEIIFTHNGTHTIMTVSDGLSICCYSFKAKPHKPLVIYPQEIKEVVGRKRKVNLYPKDDYLIVECGKKQHKLKPRKSYAFDPYVYISQSIVTVVEVAELIEKFSKLSSVAYMQPSDEYNVLLEKGLIYISNHLLDVYTDLETPLPIYALVNYTTFSHVIKILEYLGIDSIKVHQSSEHREIHMWLDNLLFAIHYESTRKRQIDVPVEINLLGQFKVTGDIHIQSDERGLYINKKKYGKTLAKIAVTITQNRLSRFMNKTCNVYSTPDSVILKIDDVSIVPHTLDRNRVINNGITRQVKIH